MMKLSILLKVVTLLGALLFVQMFTCCGQRPSVGQYPPFTKWYQNPLGISPLSLHTGNGIYIPALAATAILIFTKMDSAMSNRVSFYEDIGISYGYYASKTTVYQNNVGIQFKVRKYMSLGAEISVAHVQDEINNTWGFGIRPFVRFYPIHHKTFKLFFQSGAGLIVFAENYPKPSGFFGDNREGTRLNGSPKYGIGTDIKINKHVTTQLAVWHIHFSNGDHPSHERNPGHDSNGLSISVLYHKL